MATGLFAAVHAARDARAACAAAVDALAVDGLLPSAYLERGGRLRCMAAHGYWQVRDGMPLTAGVIGRSFRTGEEILLQDVATAAEFLEAAGGLQAEYCVPLWHAERVIGVLNIEARRTIADEEIEHVRALAVTLARRIGQLGGPPEESLGQRLARHATRLVGTHSVEDLEREVLHAALDIAPLDSALFVRVHGDGAIEPRAALGPLGRVLRSAPPNALEAIVEFVATGTSCYTVAAPGDQMASGMAPLRSAGAESVAAFGAHLDDGLAVLVLGDRTAVQLQTEHVELLELLAAHTASCLMTALAVGELRARAATDPLTGLGHHATFRTALAASTDTRVALLLCDVDGFKGLNDTRGHQAGDRLLVEIARVLTEAVRRSDSVYRIGGDEFAALVEVAGEHEALAAGARLCTAVKDARLGITLSVGVALPEPRESETDLRARADRALYAAKAAGRDGAVLAPSTPVAQQRLSV